METTPLTISETLLQIKKALRLTMNGVVSHSMREHGIAYRVNFGLTLPQIKNIAQRYTPDQALAEALWKQDIRECRILAILLYPPAAMQESTAVVWALQCDQYEIADVAAMQLYCRLPYAKKLALQWLFDSKTFLSYFATQLLNRLLQRNELFTLDEMTGILSQLLYMAHHSSNSPSSQVAIHLLQRIAEGAEYSLQMQEIMKLKIAAGDKQMAAFYDYFFQ